MRLSVVVPFCNELRALPTVIQRLLAVDFAALGVETELIFVGRWQAAPPMTPIGAATKAKAPHDGKPSH